MMRYGGNPLSSCPRNRIDPAVGASVPDSTLKIVLLPEPFGPIRPRISPLSTLKDTSLTAVNPPKRLINPLTTSTAAQTCPDRKSTRLNSSHQIISYAVFCLKKKKQS